METLQRLCVVFLWTFCCSSSSRPGELSSESTLTCDLEDVAQRLNCYGGLIIVHNVTASHRESERCVDGVPPKQLEPPLCSTAPILDIVRKRCNGRSRCTVSMDSCHAVRPCLTHCVWMETAFTCKPGKVHRVCQKERAGLHCGSQLIRVLMANYGRTSRKVCAYSAPRRQPPSTSCRHPETLQVMSNRCDGKPRCWVRASNLLFSNPCPGTRKYLQYSYTCVHPGT